MQNITVLKKREMDKNNKTAMTWQEFNDITEALAKKVYEILPKDKKIGLLGIARGGLPYLTLFSHCSGIRDFGIVHVIRTAPDDQFKYIEPQIALEMMPEDITDYIILDDILAHGTKAKTTVDTVINRLLALGKNIICVSTIGINEDWFDSYDWKALNIPIIAGYSVPKTGWIYFPWERY